MTSIPGSDGSRPDISVIVPCHNSAGLIEVTVTTLAEDLRHAGLSFEIIVVDDGSTDGTASRVSELPVQSLVVARLPRNRGKGAAVKRGIMMARSPAIIFTDDDLPYGSEAVIRCLSELRSGSQLVIGDRTLGASEAGSPAPHIRQLLSRTYSTLARRLLQREFRDTQCGVKGMTRAVATRALELSRVDRFAFDLELVLMAAENQIDITRIPVRMRGSIDMSVRFAGESVLALRDLCRIAVTHGAGGYRFASATPCEPRHRAAGPGICRDTTGSA